MRAAKGEGSMFKRDDGSYRGYVTVKGKRKYFTARTKAEAAQKKRELLKQRDEGRLATGKVWTVERATMHWLETATLKPKTYANNKWIIEQRIIPALGSTKLSELEVEDIETWLRGLNVAPASAKRYLAPLRRALAVAADRGRIGYNPADRVDLEPQKRTKVDASSREDRNAILAAANGYNAARWHLSLVLGLRPAEALGLSWQDWNPRTRVLSVRHQLLRATGFGLYLQESAKTDAGERHVTVTKKIAALLDEQRQLQLELMQDVEAWVGWEYQGQPVALIFTQENGRPIDAPMDTKRWRALLAAAGLPQVRRYSSRHTAASHLIPDSGGDVAVVSKMLGHADPAFTYRVYVHPLAEREKELMAKLDEEPDAPYGAPYEVHPSEHERTS